MSWISKTLELLKIKPSVAEPVEVVEETDHQIFQGMGDIFNFEGHQEKRISNRFYRDIWKVGTSLRKMGRKDGAIGQRPMNDSVIKTHAEQTRDYLRASVEGEAQAVMIESQKKEVLKDRLYETYQKLASYRDSLTKRRQIYPQKYSRNMGIFYLSIAMLLILADIPLAVKLTQYGFNLDMAEEDIYQISKLFLPPAGELGFLAYLKHFFLVIAHNWEVFILAFGVALSTFYIKIFYDEFVGYPADKTVTQYRELPNVEEAEIKRIRNINRLRAIPKTLILITTLGTILLLGLFRSETFKDMNTPIGEQTEWNSSSYDAGETNTSTDYIDVFQTPIKIRTFILITLLFPIIGGVCASLGLSNIQNIREIRRVGKEVEQHHKAYLLAIENYSLIKKREETWKKYQTWVNDDEFVEKYTAFFLACYRHGYEKGIIEPDNNYDLYSRARLLRDRLIASKAYQAVRLNNPPHPPHYFEESQNSN